MFRNWWSRRASSSEVRNRALQPHREVVAMYLAGVLPLLSEKRRGSPPIRTACQLFILGVVDMVRHANGLDQATSLELLEAVLADAGLPLSSAGEHFVGLAMQAAPKSEVVEKIISEGANSIRSYVAEKDANAPMDLGRVVMYAELHTSEITAAMGLDG